MKQLYRLSDQHILIDGKWHPVQPWYRERKFRRWLGLFLIFAVLILTLFGLAYYFYIRQKQMPSVLDGFNSESQIVGSFQYNNHQVFINSSGAFLQFDNSKLKYLNNESINKQTEETVKAAYQLDDNTALIGINNQINSVSFFKWEPSEKSNIKAEITFLKSQIINTNKGNLPIFLLTSNWYVWRTYQNEWKKFLTPVPVEEIADWVNNGSEIFLVTKSQAVWMFDLNSLENTNPKWKKIVPEHQNSVTKTNTGNNFHLHIVILQALPTSIVFVNQLGFVEHWIKYDDEFTLSETIPLNKFWEDRNYLFATIRIRKFQMGKEADAKCVLHYSTADCFFASEYLPAYIINDQTLAIFSQDRMILLTNKK